MARKTVNTQMNSKTLSTSGGASACTTYPHAPFNAAGASGVVPLKIMDETLKPPKMMPTPTQTAGLDSRAPRPGTTQRGFGRSDQ